MIPKPKKDHSRPENFRPISLLSTLSKVLERVVLSRLNKWIEDNQLLSDLQSGFRRGRQTKDQLLRLINDGLAAFNINAELGALFIDIEKAFDKVWHQGLLFKLSNARIPPYLGFWIANYLKDRTFKVRLSSALSQAMPIEAGVPQGSVLGPVLFLLFFNDILKEQSKLTLRDPVIGLYADDKTAWVVSRSLFVIQTRLQRQLNHIAGWMAKWRSKISTNKTVYTIFNAGKLTKSQAISLLYNNEMIKQETHPKFLGVTLDPGLNFQKFANEITQRCHKKLNMLRSIKGKSWGASSRLIINSYKALVRPVIEYAPIIYLVMSETSQLKIERIQRRAIRIAMNWPIYTTSEAMYSKAKLESVKTRATKLSLNYVAKATTSNSLIKDYITSYKAAAKVKEGSNIKAGYVPRPTILQQIIPPNPYS